MSFNFKTPSISILSAAPRSGKTFLIKDIIYKLASEGRIDHGLVFTGTAFNRNFDYLPTEIVSGYDEEKLKRFLKYQKDMIEKGNPKDAFLILDDILGYINLYSPLWTMIFSQYRHFRITIFLATQYIYRVSTVSRECATYAFIFQTGTNKSLTALYETYGLLFDKKEQFKDLINEVCVDYRCLMVVNNAPGMHNRYKTVKASERHFRLTFWPLQFHPVLN